MFNAFKQILNYILQIIISPQLKYTNAYYQMVQFLIFSHILLDLLHSVMNPLFIYHNMTNLNNFFQ